MPEPRWIATETHRIWKVWDNESAQFKYKHEKQVVRSLLVENPYTVSIAEGDREWAERQAAHYGIEIEEE